MALTMVHLIVAEQWARRHPEYARSPEYYLGAISPDAIHIRDKDDKSHKDEIHLHNWACPHPEDVIDYWRGHFTPFDVGYGVHVLTDAQWVPRFRSRLKGMLRPDGRLNTDIYYNDAFVTDFQLLREKGWLSTLLGWIDAAAVPEDHPLLTAYELDAWRKLTTKAYRGPCPKNGFVRFVTMPYVLEFADDAQRLIEETFERVGER